VIDNQDQGKYHLVFGLLDDSPIIFLLGFASSFLLSFEKEETVVIGANNGAVEGTEDVAGLY